MATRNRPNMKTTKKTMKKSATKAKPSRAMESMKTAQGPRNSKKAAPKSRPAVAGRTAGKKPANLKKPVDAESAAAASSPIPPELLHHGHGGFDTPPVHEHTKPPDVRATIRAQQPRRG